MRTIGAFGIFVTAALFISACGALEPVTLRTGSGECYEGYSGDLALDAAGSDISFDTGSGPVPVQWPSGYTGRRSGSQVEILNRVGKVLYRTGTRVNIMGDGFRSGIFKACGMELID
jgi:hypothetical protein